ncbi:MAG: TenA family protein [Rhodospirillales bacterium]
MTDTFTDSLRAAAGPAWAAATRHRFTADLAAGTLDPAVYARYLVQDFAFIEALTSFVGAAVAAAPSMAEKQRLAGFLGVLTGGENDYFERSFAALGIAPETWRNAAFAPVTRRLAGHLERAAAGGYDDILAVLAAVEWVYLDWAADVADARPAQFYFAEWIALHVDPGFRDFVGWMRAELDRRGPALPPARQDALRARFRRAIELEADFFDAAYGG